MEDVSTRRGNTGSDAADGLAGEPVGERFQQGTMYTRDELPRGRADRSAQPEQYKTYPGAQRLSLSPPLLDGGEPLWRALRTRRSVRRYAERPLTEAELSQLLWAAQGITQIRGGLGFRNAPSAGALYPVETHVVANRVEGLAPGIYHYHVALHALEVLSPGDYGEALARAALDQGMAREAGAVFVWTAVFARSKWKYGQRAYRYIYLDAGHIAQNVALAAVSLGMGSCQIAALYDGECDALLGIDGRDESVIYMTALGSRSV